MQPYELYTYRGRNMAKRAKQTAESNSGFKAEGKTRPDIIMSREDESSYISKTGKPKLGKRIRELGQTKQRFYSEKVTDMENYYTFNRFKASFASSMTKAGRDHKSPPVSHADPRVRKAIHGVLKAIHRHVFANENVKDL